MGAINEDLIEVTAKKIHIKKKGADGARVSSSGTVKSKKRLQSLGSHLEWPPETIETGAVFGKLRRNLEADQIAKQWPPLTKGGLALSRPVHD